MDCVIVDVDAMDRPHDRELADEAGDSAGAAAEIEPTSIVGCGTPYALERGMKVLSSRAPDGEKFSSRAGPPDPPPKAGRWQRRRPRKREHFE
jgi:hypothetical protein